MTARQFYSETGKWTCRLSFTPSEGEKPSSVTVTSDTFNEERIADQLMARLESRGLGDRFTRQDVTDALKRGTVCGSKGDAFRDLYCPAGW